MNKLSTEQRARIISALCEGASINSTCRMVGVAKNTVLRLIRELGHACADYQDAKLRNLPCERVQADEIWAFVHAKAKNVPEAHKGEFGYGDVWTWSAICAECKIVPSWLVGTRDAEAALEFMDDLRGRLRNRVQLTTDGHKAYLVAVEEAFGSEIDYAMLIKLYGDAPENSKQVRYSPSECIGTKTEVIQGNPDTAHISTSYAERMNLSIRMGMRRFTRLTNAHSKKLENHEYALAIYFFFYNFARVHATLKMTPAMKAGVADRVWTTYDMAVLMDSN
jgi:IS1 family transposase